MVSASYNKSQGAAAEEAAAAAQRDPRRNGMDNPFGDGRPEPMHPSLATLTGPPCTST